MSYENTNQQDTATSSDPILLEFTRADDGPRPVAWYSIKKKPELERKSIESLLIEQWERYIKWQIR